MVAQPATRYSRILDCPGLSTQYEGRNHHRWPALRHHPTGYFDEPGIHFFTSNDLSQQLASMSYAPGKVIPAHTHNLVPREVSYTQEALFIRKGKVRVDFYTQQRKVPNEPRAWRGRCHPADRRRTWL